MKRMIALGLSLMIAISVLFPVTVHAAETDCGHDAYDRNYKGVSFTSDICAKCGYIRIHYVPYGYTLPFITQIEHALAREGPRQDASVVKEYNQIGTSLQVVGRVRNERNNLWLLLSDGSYVFADRVALDFDSLASYALNSVNLLAGPSACNLSYSPMNGLIVQCSPSTLGIYGSMFIHFRPNGTFNLKDTNILGLNTYYYSVYANGIILSEHYTGEELGNILYGYTAQKVGISLRNTIRYAGLADSQGLSDTGACFFLGDLSRCDDPEDIRMIELGWYGFHPESINGRGGGGSGGRGF